MRFLFCDSDGAEIQRVATGVLERADAAFAEDDFVVAVHADIFRREQPFIDQA